MRPSPPSASASISVQRAALSANPSLACRGVQCVRLSCDGTFRWGAVSLTHLVRTLWICVKIAAMVRTLPGGLALQTSGSSCSMRIWFSRSLAAKILTASRPGCVGPFCWRLVTAFILRFPRHEQQSRSERDERKEAIDAEDGASGNDQRPFAADSRQSPQRRILLNPAAGAPLVHRQQEQRVVGEDDRKAPVRGFPDREAGPPEHRGQLFTRVATAMLVVVVGRRPETHQSRHRGDAGAAVPEDAPDLAGGADIIV